jgi:hypothetical protein
MWLTTHSFVKLSSGLKKHFFIYLSSAARRLLHTISHAETLLKVCPKFQVSISYNFRVIIFSIEIMKEGAVDPFNGWNFKAPGYLNSWQRMC